MRGLGPPRPSGAGRRRLHRQALSRSDATFTFKVIESFKGNIGTTVEVRSDLHGSSCGLYAPPDRPVGLLLTSSDGQWHATLCHQIDPTELRSAAAPLPSPIGRGLAAFLVGGSFGEARMVAIDRHARVLAYGFGRGHATHLSVCPGASRVLEVAEDYPGIPTLALRKLPSLEVVWERHLPRATRRHGPTAVTCLNERGEAYVFGSTGREPVARSRLWRVRRDATQSVYRGSARSIAFARRVAYVNEGSWGEEVGRLDLLSGEVTPVARGPRYTGELALSPDGSALATTVWGDVDTGTRPSQAVVIELEAQPHVRTAVLGPLHRIAAGDMVWLGARRLGFFPGRGATDKAIVFDRALKQLGAFRGWGASTTLVVRGDVAVGVGWGALSRARLPNGPMKAVKNFLSPETYALAPLPGVRPAFAGTPPPPQAAPADAQEAAESGDVDSTDRELALVIAGAATGVAAVAFLAVIRRRRLS
jgi:hypothetical protein